MARRNKSATLRVATTSRRQQRRSRLLHEAGRFCVWGLLAVAAVGTVWGAIYALQLLLFAHNPHFTLKQVDIRVYGELPEGVVRTRLAEAGVEERRSNLFALDPAAVRRRLEDHVQINRAEVARRLPGTLEVAVFERRPIAQLVRPGEQLVDSQGLILPGRNEPRTLLLPIITGIRNTGSLLVGARIGDEWVLSALHLLELRSTEAYGKYLDINLIQIDYASESLNVFLREQAPFREGACIILPADMNEMKLALRRVEVIIRERRHGGQTTGFIDATYRVNVPIRP